MAFVYLDIGEEKLELKNKFVRLSMMLILTIFLITGCKIQSVEEFDKKGKIESEEIVDSIIDSDEEIDSKEQDENEDKDKEEISEKSKAKSVSENKDSKEKDTNEDTKKATKEATSKNTDSVTQTRMGPETIQSLQVGI